MRAKTMDGKHIITNTFNDNVFSISITKDKTKCTKAELTNIYKIKDLKKLLFILGIAIKCNQTTGCLKRPISCIH